MQEMEKRNNFPTPFPDLNAVLRELFERVQAVLRINIVGAYLQGSFAVGAPGGTRTHGHQIRSQVLYPLSYGRITGMIIARCS